MSVVASLPGIFVSSLPKSGTVWIRKCLTTGLGMPDVTGGGARGFPESSINLQDLHDISGSGKFFMMHVQPHILNLLSICMNLGKMVLHIRDPRNACMSWLYFMDHLNSVISVNKFPQRSPYIGPHWNNCTFEQKFEVCLKFFYKETLQWLDGWFSALRIDFCSKRRLIHILHSGNIPADGKYVHIQPCSTEVLVSTHEDILTEGENKFILRILSFYDIPSSLYVHPDIQKDMSSHFRTGRKDSYQTELSVPQQMRLTESLPELWIQYFGWNT